MDAYLDIIMRSAVVYLFMILAFRIFGKRELSQLSIGDLVLIVLISNAVQNAMVGENTTLLGGLTAALVLFVLNKILNYLMFRYKGIRKMIQAEPILLIDNGILRKENLEKVYLSEDELYVALREHGVKEISEVRLSMLETDGNISVISEENKQLKRTQ